MRITQKRMNFIKGIISMSLIATFATGCHHNTGSESKPGTDTSEKETDVENRDQTEEVTGLEIIGEESIDADDDITVVDGEDGTSEVTGSESSAGGQTPASGGNGQSSETGGQNDGSGTSQSGDSGNAGSESDGFDIPIEEGEGTGGF